MSSQNSPHTSSAPLTKTTSNRLPAPSLFVGPPSRNASNTSLLPVTTTTGASTNPRVPLNRQRSLLDPKRGAPTHPHDALPPPSTTQPSATPAFIPDIPPPPAHPTTTTAAAATPSTVNASAPFSRRQHAQAAAVEAQSAERTDAIWAEMQNTLEEVELSADGPRGAASGVFGARHEHALAELREAQIALAEAWGRSEGEVEGEKGGADSAPRLADVNVRGRMAGSAGAAEEGGGKSTLEEETERDVEASRRRREANERYFRRVNAGVLEVVEKLEDVARAMKGVEVESKEIWRDVDSVETGSVVS